MILRVIIYCMFVNLLSSWLSYLVDGHAHALRQPFQRSQPAAQTSSSSSAPSSALRRGSRASRPPHASFTRGARRRAQQLWVAPMMEYVARRGGRDVRSARRRRRRKHCERAPASLLCKLLAKRETRPRYRPVRRVVCVVPPRVIFLTHRPHARYGPHGKKARKFRG